VRLLLQVTVAVLGLYQLSRWCLAVNRSLLHSVTHFVMRILHLQVNSGGAGPVSAEWMVPKALWLFQEEPDTYKV
jgi:hypothetical protein